MDDMTIHETGELATTDELRLCGHDLKRGANYALIRVTGSGVFRITADGAADLIRWLENAFRMLRTTDMQELGDAFRMLRNHLRIVVPPATGEGLPREVVWTGDEEPPEWFAGLAELALTGRLAGAAQDRQQAERSLGIVRAVSELLMDAGVNAPGIGVAEAVRQVLLERQQVRAAIHAEDVPANIVVARVEGLYREARYGKRETSAEGAMRDIMAHLGETTESAAVQRVSGLLSQVDSLTSERDRLTARVKRTDAALERSQEALRSVLHSSAPGSADTLNVVRGALGMGEA